ncbi:hypothetical protein KQ945_15645 [Bacillus subtilis subsp. subtilis]|nr:hypothetical protein [Bacillus subtilis subsp. subtilis]
MGKALAVQGGKMATDKNAFDDYLKGRLHRDILFRVLIWASVAGLATYHASRSEQFTSIAYFQRVADSLTPLVNAIGVGAIVLSAVALLLKDLERVSPDHWGQSTCIGKLGGVVRRLAGDLGLWVVGAVITILSAVVFLAFDAYWSNQMTGSNMWAILMMFVVFVILAVVISVLNTFVRRAEPPLTGANMFSCVLTTAPRVASFYAVIFAATYLLYAWR